MIPSEPTAAPQRNAHLQRIAGVVTWAIVTCLALYIVSRWENPPPVWVATALALSNLAAMLAAMADVPGRDLRGEVALWVQLFSALALGWLLPLSFMPIYTIIWTGMAVSRYAFRTCAWFLAGILLAWYLIMVIGWRDEHAAFTVFLYGTFHLFALLSARSAREAEEARQQVEALNRELMATQHLLSEASRQNERTRIARDLHDLLGHHLTALSLNLQIAEHISSGDVQARVGEARALARLLLSDVREAVSTLRAESALDLPQAIRLLVQDVPGLNIRFDVEPDFAIDDVEVAEAILRCVQEAVTNTLRHAGASCCCIRLWREHDRVRLEIHDDGDAKVDLLEGNGITGMRERLQPLAGTLRLDTAAQSLRLHIQIPLAAS